MVPTIEQIEKYIQKFNYIKFLQSGISHLNKSEKEKWGIKEEDQDALTEIALEFWKDPSKDPETLIEKHQIDRKVPFERIIQAYPTKEYVKFLKDFWNSEISIIEISKKYNLKYDIIIRIGLPLSFKVEGFECNKCLNSNGIYIKNQIEDIKKHRYTLLCQNCGEEITFLNKIINPGERLSLIDDSKGMTEEEKIRRIIVFETMENKILKQKRCPKCERGNLKITADEDLKNYKVVCDKCKNLWNNVTEFQDEYHKWEKMTFVKEKVREGERKIPEKIQKNEITDFLFKKQKLLNKEECLETLRNYTRNRLELYKYWELILEKIKVSTRAEMLVLQQIIRFCEEKGQKVIFGHKVGSYAFDLEFIRYQATQSIVHELAEATNLTNIRSPLKRLMTKGIIVFCEMGNFTDVHPMLIKNKHKLEEYLSPQNIEEDIAELVKKRGGYKCTICKGKDAQLKIAYLTKEKNPNHLDTMVPVCVGCYEDVTENESLIDGCLAIFTEEYLLKTWKMVTAHIPGWKNDNENYTNYCMLCYMYGEKKAALGFIKTWESMKKGVTFNNARMFFGYVRTTINNIPDNYTLPNELKNKYRLSDYLEPM
jgi:Zn finger protein HypA/HybF involved in hydrogenase expression